MWRGKHVGAVDLVGWLGTPDTVCQLRSYSGEKRQCWAFPDMSPAFSKVDMRKV